MQCTRVGKRIEEEKEGKWEELCIKDIVVKRNPIFLNGHISNFLKEDTEIDIKLMKSVQRG